MAMQNENASTLNLEEKSEVPGIDLEEDQESDTHAASQWQLMWWKFRKHRIAIGNANFKRRLLSEFLKHHHRIVLSGHA